LKEDAALVRRVREKTGLVIDAYFSATKIAWLLDHVPGARARAEKGELAFGTIDSFLVSQLTGGAVHVTDVTNASRTLLLDLTRCDWDPDLARTFRVPSQVLPKIVGSAEIVGATRGVEFLPDGVPIAGIAGDQQAALFGQACFNDGDAKCTYGTGAFALMNIGDRPILSEHGLVTTVAWRVGGRTTYALEGSAFIAGAAVQWLRDGLGIIAKASEIEALARRVSSSDGVVFVPALAGLGAPHWDQDARGLLTGLTRATTAAHIARATLEGIDGGASANDLLMQFQADVADVVVERASDVESTGRGAAMLAAVGAGLLGMDDAATMAGAGAAFAPRMPAAERSGHIARWNDALRRARSSA
jgi:glycerol kinase